jgi:hypothetical protein
MLGNSFMLLPLRNIIARGGELRRSDNKKLESFAKYLFQTIFSSDRISTPNSTSKKFLMYDN